MSAVLNNTAPVSTAKDPKVALVLVNYNSTDHIQTCLRSLAQLDYKNYQLLVVDNDSNELGTDTLAEMIEESGGVFIRSPENVGFAAANNIGIRYALASGVDYIWLLNPDTVVARDSLSSLVKRASELREPAMLGSKILYGELDPAAAVAHASAGVRRDGSERVWSAGGAIDVQERRVEMRGWGKSDDGSYDSEAECAYLPGCSLFFSKALIDVGGLMDENFFMYFEETDWCVQLRHKGVKLLYLPSSVVWHRFSDEKLQGPRTVYYYNRNEMFFWYRQLPLSARIKMLLTVLLKKLPQARRALREAPSEEMRELFSAHVRANRDFLIGRRGRVSFA